MSETNSPTPESDSKPISVSRLSFPLAVVLLMVSSAVSVAVSNQISAAAVRGELAALRTEVATMNTKQETRDGFYREAIAELKQEGMRQKIELQTQMRALEYVVQEVKISLARREARDGG